ncbi:hypothetical protein J4760_02675 [Salinicoccus sp. ID82-1]|uniref:hypothetical protein n=1 Tax=Salinicoccus sp. ID82-1 TaxID=2820269 RepID=UPI001F2E767D|nr:hypothetical protein [Salinicoccus sp. ID82-1]MCG1008953.1 hypothetical protein [Salinicoccus sp. ID82-1]
MSITIKRSTNSIGMGMALKVKADGREIERIYHEEEKEINLARPVAEISVSRWLSRSNTITVADQSYVIIHSTIWRSISIIVYIVLLAITMLALEDILYKTLGFLAASMIALILEYTFEQFRLEEVEFEEERRF